MSAEEIQLKAELDATTLTLANTVREKGLLRETIDTLQDRIDAVKKYLRDNEGDHIDNIKVLISYGSKGKEVLESV